MLVAIGSILAVVIGLCLLRPRDPGGGEGMESPHITIFPPCVAPAVDGATYRRSPGFPGDLAAPRPERLWFVNLGAYRPDSLAELHHFGLVVASSPQAAKATAKATAKRQWLRGALQQHKDDLCAVDDCLAIEQLALLDGGRWHVQLTPHPEGSSQPQVPDWFGYRRIDRI
jgi:hypothetical protein